MIQFTNATRMRKMKVDSGKEASTDVEERKPFRPTAEERSQEAKLQRQREREALEDAEKLRIMRTERTARLRTQRLGSEAAEKSTADSQAPVPDQTAVKENPPGIHSFRVGQQVVLSEPTRDDVKGRRFEVCKLLPATSSRRFDVQYRIKDTVSGQERMMLQKELAPA